MPKGYSEQGSNIPRRMPTIQRLHMTIQEVTEQTGISAYTIRFYEKTGVRLRIKCLPNGIRQFSDADVIFLYFMVQLK
jgi:MerR family transcriptional regulator, aldehyde-responsive regulator